MNASGARSVEVDFLRGLALIVIAIDHISVGVLSYGMPHSYAYCDAAEAFVFLGGYASAAGYAHIAARCGESAARLRFIKRAWAIYRAYLLTAALMLACGAALTHASVISPLTAEAGWPVFAQHPLRSLADIALLRQQPLFSAVLPMYMLFALTVPISVPFARRAPVAAFAVSLAFWLAAPRLAVVLPEVVDGGWPFNPFAWQLMFMLGVLCRLYPVPAQMQTSNLGNRLTSAACAVALTFAFVKLGIDAHPAPGFMKQNLASVRIVSFLSLAWLCAQAARLGWMRELASRWPGVVTVGKEGLVCFVGGTIVSIAIDTALRLVHGQAHWPLRLLGDVTAILALVVLARAASHLKAMRTRRAASVPAIGLVR
ncbi:MAG TPA: OpgC domain-containing protein [Trinickia sp.]|nr:OpgC domain-containing protein [Trinickia sp.]